MKTRHKFSIIIPMYNTEMYIADALDSILRQSVSSYEVVIINDGSTDASYDIAKKYEKIIKNFKIINKNNAGIIEARRDGIKAATGEYIVFLDSDDFLDDNCLKLFEEIIKEYNPDIVRGNYSEYHQESDSFKKINHFENKLITLNDQNRDMFFNKVIGDYRFNDVVREAFKKDLIDIDKIPKKISMGDDVAISYMSLKNAKSIYFVSDTLYYYRINNNSICHRRDDVALAKNVKDITLLYEFLIPFFEEFINNKSLIKKIYMAYLKHINTYFSLFYYNCMNKQLIEKTSKEIFNNNLLLQSKKYINFRYIINKDFVLLISLLLNKRKMYLFLLKIKHRIRKIIKK